VTSNTRRDGEEFLALAARIPVQVTTTRFPFDAADEALAALAADQVRGAAVLTMEEG
jgi:alcohol dehydrogenase, propanol-preferring